MKETQQAVSPRDISFLCELVEQAGARAAQMRASISIREKSNPQDLVTDADEELSRTIVTALRKQFPGDMIISEEDVPANKDEYGELPGNPNRRWFIDPIDGTDNYIGGDGQYAVMIGLVEGNEPVFGCVFLPFASVTVCGGPKIGLWTKAPGKEMEVCTLTRHNPVPEHVRLVVGARDQGRFPWVNSLENISLVRRGSVGLKVYCLMTDEADVYLGMSGKLKLWDTAGPAAIAQAAGLEVGTIDDRSIEFPHGPILHHAPMVFGKPGAIEWSRKNMLDHLKL